MPQDRIDELFGDLTPGGKDYPGKREPALRNQHQSGRHGAQPLEEWDDKPRVYKYRGVDKEFFTIRHVAKALGRTTRTIRSWEIKEAIPPATYRSTAPKKSKVKEAGDRLWTREQVEAMIRIAREEGVLDGKPPSNRFTFRLVKAFLALQQHTTQEHT